MGKVDLSQFNTRTIYNRTLQSSYLFIFIIQKLLIVYNYIMTQKSKNIIKILGIILQNQQGMRFYSKYYFKHFNKAFYVTSTSDLTKIAQQRVFQKNLLNKVKRMEVLGIMKPEDIQIFNYNKYTVQFKVINELQIYIIADQQENQILLADILNCIQKVLSYITKQPLNGKAIYDILQDIMLIIDEIIDEGIPVTLEPELIYSRIRMKEGQPPSPDQTQTTQAPQQQQQSKFSSLFGFAKSSLQKSLNFG